MWRRLIQGDINKFGKHFEDDPSFNNCGTDELVFFLDIPAQALLFGGGTCRWFVVPKSSKKCRHGAMVVAALSH